jgi:hypothetical protein
VASRSWCATRAHIPATSANDTSCAAADDISRDALDGFADLDRLQEDTVARECTSEVTALLVAPDGGDGHRMSSRRSSSRRVTVG